MYNVVTRRAVRRVWVVTGRTNGTLKERTIMTKDIGMIALAIWLILEGLLAVFSITFAQEGVVMGILALIAGVLILLSPRISSRR
jgi:hypothetical protein